jgi:pyrophosphatase PpaX
MNQIKAVLFDIDGVLLDSFEANLKFFQDLLAKAGYRGPTREEFTNLFHVSMMGVIRKYVLPYSDEEIQRVFDMGESREVDYPSGLLKMPKNAEHIIRELKKQYVLGIVSSRVRSGIYEAPALAKLKDCFHITVAYEDTAKHKPDPEPLLLAAAKLGLKPQEMVYIGDAESDFLAAKAAGMKIIAYAKEPRPDADACTFSFDEIPRIITKLNK